MNNKYKNGKKDLMFFKYCELCEDFKETTEFNKFKHFFFSTCRACNKERAKRLNWVLIYTMDVVEEIKIISNLYNGNNNKKRLFLLRCRGKKPTEGNERSE